MSEHGTIVFQAINWMVKERRPWKFNKNASENDIRYLKSTTLIQVCGRTEEGHSVHVCITDIRPIFYAKCDISRFYACVTKAKNFDKYFDDYWIDQITPVSKQVFQGFRNNEKQSVLKIVASGRGTMTAMSKVLADHGITTYNTKIDVLHSLFHSRGILPCGWMSVSTTDPLGTEAYSPSRCDYDIVTESTALTPISKPGCMAPFLNATLDVEVVSPQRNDGGYDFPDPQRAECPISCMCIRTTWTSPPAAFVSDPQMHGFVYKDVDIEFVKQKSPGMIVHQASSEREMLQNVVHFMRELGADVIRGWNTLNFDMRCIWWRCHRFKISLETIGKFDTYAPKLKERTLSTAGSGHHVFHFFDIPGVFQMDLFCIVKRDFKLESYSLNAVSKAWLNNQKIDLPPKEIFRKSVGTPTELAEVLVYCERDVGLPDDIDNFKKLFVKAIGFANKSMVEVNELLLRGANIKTLSLLADECHSRGWIISDESYTYNSLQGKYQGALVIDPIKGLHKDPVATLDFKSLYPSVMISQQLGPDTFVDKDEYLGLPGVDYKVFEWNDEITNRHHKYTFVTNRESLTSAVLIRLWNDRNESKRKMKYAKDANEESIYDGEQLAVKLLMNSIYGFYGAAATGILPHVPTAMVTTMVGRYFLTVTQKYMLAKYGKLDGQEYTDGVLQERMQLDLDELKQRTTDVEIVYGDTDSVFVKFKVPDYLKSDQEKLEFVAEKSIIASNECTRYLNLTECPVQGRVELEFEKILYWLICYTKKRYAYVKYTDPKAPGKFGAMGLQFIRRDFCKLAQDLAYDTLYALLAERDLSKPYKIISQRLHSMLDRSTASSMLEISKTLKSDYKITPPAHAMVAQKMRERGEDVTDGDRVRYVFVIAEGRLQSHRTEDPVWACENNIPIDYVAYIDSQIYEPMTQNLSIIDPSIPNMITALRTKIKNAQRENERLVEQRSKKMKPISSFFIKS